MTFGNFLQRARAERNLSLLVLAAKAGIAEQRLKALDTDSAMPTYQEVVLLASALGLPRQRLLAEARQVHQAPPAVRSRTGTGHRPGPGE
jgi:transcriptional regulator with XRE-family HTH domain